jgi:signal transduction histidine kinase
MIPNKHQTTEHAEPGQGPEAPFGPLCVLVVDDDADTRTNLSDVLALDDYRVETAGTMAQALARDDWREVDVVILDRKLPDGSAEELLPRLRRLAPHAAVIIVTGYADLEGAIAAIRQGAADYLLKPVNLELLRPRLAGIAERKRAEATIISLNQDIQRRVTDLRTLLDVTPIGISIAEDPECRSIRVNRSFARLLRIAPDAVVSLAALYREPRPFRFLRDGKDVPAHELPIQLAARGTEVRDAEIDVVFPDGTVVNLFGHAAPLPDEQGRSRGAIAAFLDVTERKLSEERLVQSERLAAIGQMMTGLAHESGNALARSRACLEMLALEVEDRADAVDLVSRTLLAQDHLQQLYEEVRGYAAPLRLDREVQDLQGTWRQAWATLELVRKGRAVTLREETDGVDLRCPIDLFRVQQVFRNILENSLAACADPVEITVACSDAVLQGRPALQVSVRDNGPGLNAEQRQRIFEPFYTTKTKGTGLGMAIARRIIEAHGGRIAVGTGAARGAEILITLPRASS